MPKQGETPKLSVQCWIDSETPDRGIKLQLSNSPCFAANSELHKNDLNRT